MFSRASPFTEYTWDCSTSQYNTRQTLFDEGVYYNVALPLVAL